MTVGLITSVASPTATALGASQSTADKIEARLSYGLVDWTVSRADQRAVIDLLRADPDINQTVSELRSDGWLPALVKRVDIPELRRELVDVLARRTDDASAAAVRGALEDMDVQHASGPGGASAATIAQDLWQVRFNLVRLGVPTEGRSFNRAPFADLLRAGPTAPFSGVGATGVNPTTLSVPLGDQWRLLRGDGPTTARYSNPLEDLGAYVDGLSVSDRTRQAQLLLRQPISTVMPDIWGDHPPSRADVIAAAARRYGLDPAVVSGFLLAEQRDQSRLEDAKDYASATSVVSHNASLGLGQVVVSTAERNQLFSAAISDGTMRHSSHTKTARLLEDDVLNIFAAAKYIRAVADQGAAKPASELGPTLAEYPGLRLGAYRGSAWPADNIRALGSEYTSRAWDNRLVPAWGELVHQSVLDVRASGVFR